jgi:hypothetical protein
VTLPTFRQGQRLPRPPRLQLRGATGCSRYCAPFDGYHYATATVLLCVYQDPRIYWQTIFICGKPRL